MFLLQRRLLMTTSVAALSAATVAVSDAETLAGSETDALAIVYTDTFYKSTSGFNGSVFCVDSGTPANDYSNSPTTEAASYFTYTSPSPKMILHDDGVLKYNAHNLYLNSASPANQSITVVSSATYAVTITGSVSVTASGAATGTWTAGTNTFTAATTTLTLGSTSGSGTVHVRRTPSDSTYMETAGSIRYADPIEFNSSGTALGALVEPQRTNLIAYHSQFDNAAWIQANLTDSPDAVAAPNGLTQADTLTASSGAGIHATYFNSSSGGAGTTVTESIYVKKGTHRYVCVCDTFNTSNYFAAVFDLDGGGSTATETSVGLGSGTIVSTSQTAVGDGWYRLTVTGSHGQATHYPGVGFAEAATGNTFSDFPTWTAAGTETIHVWGAQLEVGSSATSQIETYGSSVTRAADNISKASSGFPNDTANMTLYVDLNAISTGSEHFINISDGTTTNRFLSYATSGSFYVFLQNSSGTQMNQTIGSISTGSNQKIAISYELNSGNGAVDGTASTEDTSVAVPASFTTLRLGADSGGASQMHGYIRSVLILPRRVSDADMETLTSTGALP